MLGLILTLRGKGRRRLSSLFSSSSLSSYAESSPATSLKGNNMSAPTSGASTPTRSTLAQSTLPDELNALDLSTEPEPITQRRTASLYSAWELEEAAEEESDEEYLTPSEGLSEVEEEDEPEPVPQAAAIDIKEPINSSPPDAPDVLGTGPSTIRRTKPSAGETKVRRRTAKSHALDFDQAESLATDIDICRQILTLFLTSKMKEAEDMCFETDPDGNHLYLISAHGIINGLKVRPQAG